MQHLIRQAKAAGRTDALAHVDSRPPISEAESIQRMALFASYTGTKIHIFHLTLARRARHDRGVARGRASTSRPRPASTTASSTPSDMPRLGSVLRMNPPVRSAEHGKATLPRGSSTARSRRSAPTTRRTPREEKLNDDIWKAISGFTERRDEPRRLPVDTRCNAGRHDARAARPRRPRRARPRSGTCTRRRARSSSAPTAT